jgi:hypothetical protein
VSVCVCVCVCVFRVFSCLQGTVRVRVASQRFPVGPGPELIFAVEVV